MKLVQLLGAVATAALWTDAIAAPLEAAGSKGLRRREEEKKPDPSKNKYFHEPGGGDQLGHYDARYFKQIVSYDERTETQINMIRAYLDFFRENGLDTWIAHGTLLGWWWNGQRLPWDWDLDTQVSGVTLHYMGEHFNGTKHKYVPEDKNQEAREFLLDVNPWIWERERGDGMNVIDARWIDLKTGLFIDITGLSETHPDRNPGVWVCKNYHRYHTSDLYPLRESVFEGVPAKIPYAYDKMLTEEYQPKALVLTEYEGHVWRPDQRAWVITQAQLEKEAKEAEEREKKKEEEEKNAKEEEEKKAKQEEERKVKEEELRNAKEKEE